MVIGCREQFTPRDAVFLLEVLGKKPSEKESLSILAADQNSFDELLDLPDVYKFLVDSCDCLPVSHAFYFYVVMRHALLEAGIPSRDEADYVASILTQFSDFQKFNQFLVQNGLVQDAKGQSLYLIDMLSRLEALPPYQAYMLLTFIGDYSLYLSGMFLGKIKASRDRHGGPEVSYYESVGQQSYHLAALDQRAHKQHVDKVLEEISHQFHQIRLILNQLTDSVFHITDEGLGFGQEAA
jgi:hypothetical protein